MPTAPKTTASLDQRIQPKFLERVNIMANNNLQGKKIAILVADGFEQVELLEPRKALDEAGATTQVVSSRRQESKRLEYERLGR
jgi:DJ-1/PfpI family